MDDFFQALYDRGKKWKENWKLVNNFLEESPHKVIENNWLPCKVLLNLFIKYNTPILSSSAVERLFSMRKDVLKTNREGLSDSHFEILVILKGKWEKLKSMYDK